MFAVITLLRGKKLSKKIVRYKRGHIVHIKVGEKVSRRKILKQIKPFYKKVVFSRDFNFDTISGKEYDNYKNDLLFLQFFRYVTDLHSISLRVGIIDPYARYKEGVKSIIPFVESVVLYTEHYEEDFLRECIMETGICPETADKISWLSDCDCVFSPDGFDFDFDGKLFGKGGCGVNLEDFDLPDYIVALKQENVEISKVLYMLSFEDKEYRPFNLFKRYSMHKNIYLQNEKTVI